MVASQDSKGALCAVPTPTSSAFSPEDSTVVEPGDDHLSGDIKPLCVATSLASAIQRHHQALATERPPKSHLEEIFLCQIARHAAHLELSDECAIGILDAAEVSRGPAAPQSNAGNLIAALRSPAQASVLRYQAVHQRGLALAAREWMKVQAQASSTTVPEIFADEAACVEYLREWQSRQPWECSDCLSQTRCWLAQRAVYECKCGKQYSAREGTLFAMSHLPLITWFRLVTSVICAPTQPAAQRARELGFGRAQTIGVLVRKTHETLHSSEADCLLAGLPEIILGYLC